MGGGGKGGSRMRGGGRKRERTITTRMEGRWEERTRETGKEERGGILGKALAL